MDRIKLIIQANNLIGQLEALRGAREAQMHEHNDIRVLGYSLLAGKADRAITSAIRRLRRRVNQLEQ